MSAILISFHHSADADLVDTNRLERLVASVLESESRLYSEIGIVLTRHEHLRTLNRDFLEHDFETDVLSFLLSEEKDILEGEVYVDVETAAERHSEFQTSITREIERYVAHGVLHLVGYADDTPEKKREMHALESTYLDALDAS